MYFKPKMSYKEVCKEPNAKITIPLFSNSDTLERTTIHAQFGSFQFPWFQACGVFANSSYFLVILKLMASKESLRFLTPKLPITFTNNSIIPQFVYVPTSQKL